MTAKWQRWKGIQKCYPFEESRLAKWKPPFIIQIKYDGNRCRNDPLQNNSLLLTSEENIFYSVPHINEQLDSSGLFNFPLDGELYNHDVHKEGGHELIHSIVSRTINLHPRYKEIEFHIFDLKYPTMPQLERLIALEKLKDAGLPKNIVIAPFWICYTLDEIKSVYDKIINLKHEGIIVRHHMADYRDSRSIFVMKLKPKKKDDYKIVGYNEEISKDGVPKDRLGSIMCSSQVGDTFSVSAGLNDNDREYFWSIRDSLIGKTCEVYYQHLSNRKVPKGSFDLRIKE